MYRYGFSYKVLWKSCDKSIMSFVLYSHDFIILGIYHINYIHKPRSGRLSVRPRINLHERRRVENSFIPEGLTSLTPYAPSGTRNLINGKRMWKRIMCKLRMTSRYRCVFVQMGSYSHPSTKEKCIYNIPNGLIVPWLIAVVNISGYLEIMNIKLSYDHQRYVDMEDKHCTARLKSRLKSV